LVKASLQTPPERTLIRGALAETLVTPWGFVAASIGLAGGVIALLLYIIAAAAVLRAMGWPAAKVYRRLEGRP
jgi:hypothetical protein